MRFYGGELRLLPRYRVVRQPCPRPRFRWNAFAAAWTTLPEHSQDRQGAGAPCEDFPKIPAGTEENSKIPQAPRHDGRLEPASPEACAADVLAGVKLLDRDNNEQQFRTQSRCGETLHGFNMAA